MPVSRQRRSWTSFSEMTPDPVAFLDSGVGGLPYLAHTRAKAPRERYVYVADRENFPYGEKDPEQIVHASISVTERLIAREHPRLIVVACNTISVVALAALRGRFALPFVGVVPAVKPAAALSRKRRVGVLATRQTVEGEYLRRLIETHAADCTVVSLPAAGLVEYVEEAMFRATPEERMERVRLEVERFHDERIDALVLGCTHFLHLEEEFRDLLGREGITLVDSREGVSRQVQRLLAESRSGADAGGGSSLYVTGPVPLEPRYSWFAGMFDLRLEEAL
jgi:glutamate racemase